MKRGFHFAAMAVLLSAGFRAVAEGPPPTTRAAQTQPASPGVRLGGPKDLKFPHMRVDLAGREIVIDAETCEPSYGLEFLLCRRDTKEYESLLRTDALGANLHAALLALGLTAGLPARWSGPDEAARFLSAQGPELLLRVRWQDEKGRHQVDAGQWLANAPGKTHRPPRTWIFLGSWVLPDGRYLADLPEEGGLISVANLASAVIDVPFESTQTLDQREFGPNTAAMPAPGTSVELVIHPIPGAEDAPGARAMLEIDRFGRLRIDGLPIGLEALTEWAQRYIARHSRGMVILRADAHALVDDVRLAKEALQYGGVRETDEIYLPPARPVLPRTPQQATEAIAEWKRRFAEAGSLLLDPFVQAAHAMAQIEAADEESQDLREIRRQYAQQLRELLARHKAAAQTAPQPAGETTP